MFKKILSFYTKYFAVWIIVFGVLAYLFPGPFRALRSGMDWFFALTMFGIGVVLKLEDFQRIIAKPAIVLIGTVAQYTIMPFGVFAAAKLFNLPQSLAVGLILTGSAPGAMASNVISYIAKAERLVTSLISTSDQLGEATSHLRVILEKANRGDGTIAKLLNDGQLYENMLESTEQMRLLLEELKSFLAKSRDKGLPIKLK
jgi:hypothetical protein